MKLGWCLGAVAIAAAVPAMAEDTYYWPAPARTSEPGTRAYFPTGTPLVLRTRTEANTKQVKPGDRVQLEVAESLVYRGQVVVPAGSPAVAQVVRSERNGHFGKKGHIEIRILHVQTPHGPVRLDGRAASQGRSAAAWSVPAGMLVAWPLFIVHGTSGYIRQGTIVRAAMAEPLSFTVVPATEQVAAVAVADEVPRPLPARFDPSVFGKGGPGLANR